MFLLYSKKCEYAIRVLAGALRRGNEQGFQAAEVCRRVRVPEPYARKGLRSLALKGILKPMRGRSGGYSFARPAGSISILEIVTAVDGTDSFERCVMGFAECGAQKPCPLHHVWKKVKHRYLKELGRKTLSDLKTLGLRGFETLSAHPKKKRGRIDH